MAFKRGTDFAEQLFGTSSSDVIEGLGGNDVLNGLGGNDLMFGGAGDDILDGGDGNDEMHGGTGNDTYYATGGDTVVEAAGGGYDHVMYTGTSYRMPDHVERLTMMADTAFAHGNELGNRIDGNDSFNLIEAHGGNDVVKALGGDDEVYGDAGNDSVFGGEGNDILFGDDYGGTADGNDSLRGEGGSDWMRGGGGNDFLDGGTGIDISIGDTGVDTIKLDLDDLKQGGVRIHGHHSGPDEHADDELQFSGSQLLDLTQIADEKIQSIEVLNMLLGDHAARFTRADVAAMSDDDELLILGGAGDSVTSVGQGWKHLADVFIDGVSYEHYNANGVDVFVDSDINQVFS